MTVSGRGLIFQPVLASLPYTQKWTYNNDAIVTLWNILPLQISHQFVFNTKITILADVFDLALE